MLHEEITEVLGGWQGYSIGGITRYPEEGEGITGRYVIELQPLPSRVLICDGCGQEVHTVHEMVERIVRDLPIFDATTWLVVHRCRVECSRCGAKLERLDWLDRYSRVTRRLAESVARLCQVLPVKNVAALYHLSWDQVKAIDKAYLTETFGSTSLASITVLAMDEFAIRKGHRYATVVVEPHTRRVLWIGRGRGRKDIHPFFELLGADGCARIEAVVMDMNGAYEQEVREHCPRARIVYDLFHVVAKYGREVIDRVRVNEANRLRTDKKARKVVKTARWLLLRNRENLRDEDTVKLKELLTANKSLATVYVLKDDLKHLWEYRDPATALQFWHQWYHRAVNSRIVPLKQFAIRLKSYMEGIVAHCQWPLNTSVLEGINNKIKVIKRMAYGFRDDDYFFLKIKAAFPGIPG
jgi:transposase